MTSISSNQTPQGYAIREFPRGPLIGWSRTVSYRRWRASCAICSATYLTDRRMHGARQLALHYQGAHQR